MVGANDLEASKKFYDAVLGTLGIGPGVINTTHVISTEPLRVLSPSPNLWTVSPQHQPTVARLVFWQKR